MPGADKALHYKITTEAQLAAADKAIGTFEKLDETTQAIGPAAEEAAKAVEQMGDDAVKAVEKVVPSVEETKRALQELGLEAADVERKGKPMITWLGSAGEQAVKAGTQAGGFSRQLGGIKNASEGASTALGGLARGGIAGTVDALKGGAKVVTAFATSALGGVLLPVLAAGAVAFGIMAAAVNKNRDTMKKWYDMAAQESARTKAAIEAANKAVVDSFAPHIKAIEEAAGAYEKLTQKVDATRRETEELHKKQNELRLAEINAAEQQALVGKTDEQAAKITKEFDAKRNEVTGGASSVALENAKLAAELDLQHAVEAQAKARTELDAARVLASEAAVAAKNAIGNLKQFADEGGDPFSIRGNDLRAAAKAADSANKTAAAELAKAEAVKLAADEATEARIAAADRAKRLIELDAKILAATEASAKAAEEAARAKEREAAAAKIKALSEEARAAADKGDQRGQDMAVAEIKKVRDQLKASAESNAAAASSIDSAAASAPPPLNLKPVADAFITYNGVQIKVQKNNENQFANLKAAIDAQAAEFKKLSTKVDNLQSSKS